MIDLLQQIAALGEHVRDWEVTRQPDGVLLRVRSRDCYRTEAEAEEAAADLLGRLVAPGYQPVTPPVTTARPEDARGEPAWRACVEAVLSRGRLVRVS